MTISPSGLADSRVVALSVENRDGLRASIPAEEVATAAGNDETIPRWFLALFDAAVLIITFVVTPLVAPWVQWLLLPWGPLSLPAMQWLDVPRNAGAALFPPLLSMAWLLAVTIPGTL